ncbi:MAG: protein-disulfide reductase DsbD domain-containing protein, partial [Dongiaceae bacterium]
MIGRIGIAFAAFMFMNVAGVDVGAVESEWARTDQSAVRLIAATTGVGDAANLRVGLEFDLQPGWKTYWRSPGDAGFPITVDWTGSVNLAQATVSWPAPHRITLFGLDTFGYEQHVVLPIVVAPQQRGQPVGLRAKVDYLVCTDICIPHQALLSLDLPAGAAAPSDHVQLIDQYVARVPGDGARQGLRLEHVGIARDGERPVLAITARADLMPFDKPDLIVEAPAGLYFAAPDVAMSEGGHVASFRLPATVDAGAPPLDQAELTLTLVDGVRGLERRLVPAVDGEGAPLQVGPALLSMLLVALFGGLVLNVMPCVMPVLSLKLLG